MLYSIYTIIGVFDIRYVHVFENTECGLFLNGNDELQLKNDNGPPNQ